LPIFYLQTSTVGNHVYIADMDDHKDIVYIGSHLECFAGGNWILGSYFARMQKVWAKAFTQVARC